MLVVVLEPSMRDTRKWEGVFGGEIGGMLYLDMSSDNEMDLYEKTKELSRKIHSLVTAKSLIISSDNSNNLPPANTTNASSTSTVPSVVLPSQSGDSSSLADIIATSNNNDVNTTSPSPPSTTNSSSNNLPVDYEKAWKLIEFPEVIEENSKYPEALLSLLRKDLGVTDFEDFDGLEKEHLEAISKLLKPAKAKNFKKYLKLIDS